MILVDQQRTMDRAVLRWSEDRNVYINKIAARLHEDPGVARALEGTKQGVEWLLKSWLCLEEVLEYDGRWTDEQNRLAMALVGPRVELRDSYCTMLAESDAAELADLVKNESDVVGTGARTISECPGSRRPVDGRGRDAHRGGCRDQAAPKARIQAQARPPPRQGRAAGRPRRSRCGSSSGRRSTACAGSEPVPEPEPVVSSIRSKPVQEPDPPNRPKTSNAAFNFLKKRSMRDAFEIPATATAAAKRVSVAFPFPGGDPEPELDPDSEPETEVEVHDEAEVEPIPPAEPVIDRPQAAPVASNASRVATANQRREQERRKHRALEKKARKAARRNRR